MKASRNIAINTLCISFLFISSNAFHINDTLTINESSPDLNHKFESFEECNMGFLSSFRRVMMKTRCKPRPTAVEIIPPSPNILIIPNKVVVNRCDGMCHAKHSCLATEKKMVQISVQQMNLIESNAMPQCGIVHIEEHVKCRCRCTVMKEDCNERQVYVPNECMCLCPNIEEETRCIKEGNTWDNIHCSC